MTRRFSSLAVLLAVALGAPSAALGQTPPTPPAPPAPPAPGPEDQALPSLSAVDRVALAPLLDRGPIALVSFIQGEEVPSILVAIDIRAPAARVAALIADPSHYPQFIPVLHDVHITGTHAQSIAYDWTWHTAVLELHGTNELDSFPPPAGHEDRGWRYSVRTTQGDLGRGRIVWRVLPQGDGHTLLTVAMRLDIRDANYVAREMSSGGRTVNRAVALSLGTLLALGTRREAERLVSAPPRPPLPHGGDDTLVWPQFDANRILAATLAYYDLVRIELDEHDRLVRVWSLGRAGAHTEAVTSVLTDPSSFGSALVPGAQAQVIHAPDAEGGVLFDWGVDIPLIGTSGRMRMRTGAADGAVLISGVTGALHTGRWRFEQRPAFTGEVFVLTGGDFDIADSAWLVRSLVDGCPDLAVGLAAAAEVMVVRAVRSRAMEVEAAAIAARAQAAQAHADTTAPPPAAGAAVLPR